MTALVVLTVIDIVLLIAGLAFYLFWVGTLLTRIAGNLEESASIVDAIVDHAKLIGPGVEHINRTGGVVAGALPLLYGMAEEIVTDVTPAPERRPCPSRPGPLRGPAARGCTTRWASPRAPDRARDWPCGAAGPRLCVQAWSGPRRATGPVVGAEYSPIHSSFQAGSYCWSLQLGW